MAAQNRMKQLQVMNNNPDYRATSSLLFSESGVIETLSKKYGGGPEFTRKLRTSEINVSLPPAKAWLINHHVEQAREWFNQQFVRHALTDHISGPGHIIKQIRKLPESLLRRLGPCFDSEHPEVWDPSGALSKRFNGWKSALIKKLDQIDQELPRGKGRDTRKFEAYTAAFWELHLSIDELLDDMVKAARGN